jgi:hypothetical protein
MVTRQFEFRRFGQRLDDGHALPEQHGHDADLDRVDEPEVEETPTQIAAAKEPDVLAGLIAQGADV